MTLTPILDTTNDINVKHTQETLNSYVERRCKIAVLRPHDCGRRVFLIRHVVVRDKCV